MIQAGARLGVYEIVSPLGAGGMGEVYRARDTRLHRDVAIKVLPREFAGDPARQARFEAEARSVAALNHPNILALYDVGVHNGTMFLVAELVDGESLRDARLSPRKALDVAAQMAEGLAAAHAAGVVHRDLKPDNVMLTRDGRVKILDFGLARLGEAAEPGVTRAHTEIGTIVGTAGYMAPEQIRGLAVDGRTDIFAFGATLYELLTGSRAFDGDTPAEVMTAILRHDPPDLPPPVPSAAHQIVQRCLDKNPEERFQSARDLAFALRHLAGVSASGVQPAPGGHTGRRWSVLLTAAALAAGAMLGAGLALVPVLGRDDGVDPVQLTRVAADRLDEFAPEFSPDGRTVAYMRRSAGLTELLVKPLDALAPAAVVRSTRPIVRPRWTPDGNRLCYVSAGELWCVGAAGGTPQRVVPGIVFSPQLTREGDSVLFIRAAEDDNQPWLFRAALTGGDPRKVGDAPLPSNVAGVAPFSPDGTRVVVFGDSFRWLVRADDGARRPLPVEEGVRTVWADWLPDNRHLALVEDTTNPAGTRLVIADTESPARRLVLRTADPITSVSVSPEGTRLVYAGGRVERDIAEYTTEGTFVRALAASAHLEGFPAWTPDGGRFVYRVGGPGQVGSLWVGYVDGTPPAPLAQLPSDVSSLHRVSPDGGRIVYADPSGIHVLSTAGGRAIRVVPPLGVIPSVCWSADGEWIWYEGGPVTLHKVRSHGGDPVRVEAALGQLVDCSPDGRWLARSSRGGGLMLTSTDGTSQRVIPDTDGFVWSGEAANLFGQGGTVLYLLSSDRRSITTVEAETGRRTRSIVFELPAEDTITGYAVNPAGTRVLLTTGGSRNDLWIAEGFAQPSRGWRRWFRHWASPARTAAQP